MSVLRPAWLLAICLGTAVAGWIAQLYAASHSLAAPVLHWTSLLTLGAVALITLSLGLRVLRYRQGKLKRRLDPIQAARTLVLAQSSAYAGSLIAGWHLGILIDLLPAAGMTSASVLLAFVMTAAGVVMVIVGWVVEQFCKLPPEDPSAPDAGGHKREDNEGYAAGTG